jgi:photosystem II stability/assembly factor-like uncharacterized protein
MLHFFLLAAALGAQPRFDSGTISGLGARNIGSAVMSGRIAAIAGRHEADGKTTLLIGAASGGVWKSSDGGTTFQPIFDKEPVQSIGAIALDPNHPNTYWVGTGESWTRNSVSIGDGVYKSTDGGDSWTNTGLPNSERIAKIVVDPRNGSVVYVCATGRLWSDSPDRGVYKTTDGGVSWSLVLKGPNLSTGCSSLALDPANPDRLFAGMWDFRRKGWTFRSGGDGPAATSGSGFFVTNDGGASWRSLEASSITGLPKAPWGRVAVAIAPSDSKVVYAFIESARSALFRSDDGGKTWVERDRSQNMVWRPFYFANLIVDPTNPNRIFKTDGGLIESEDGGKSFSSASGGTHGDHHDVWIDPANPNHVATGDDGGLWISYDGASTWVKNDNLPIGQFYHVALDDKDPYQVYGGLQDNTDWVGDSAYPGGVSYSRWENFLGGDGFYVFPDESDPLHYLYAETQGGTIARVNRQTLETRDIQPKSESAEKLRFNWNAPMAASPNEKGTIYIGAQYLFRSRDHGQTWSRISPDLTTNDPQKQKQEESGGITVDNSVAEMYTTIFSISESPLAPGTIWVGTDDGNVQLTRNGGSSWSNLIANIKGVPPASWVSWVQASRFAAGTAYVAIDRHTFGDFEPYVYRTTDFGKSWARIASPSQGIRGYAHVIKEDTQKPGLLFLGTEFGLWISIDGGARWAAFKGGDFPSVPVDDLAIQPRDSDLVLATHGRGIWIVDDIAPLRHLNDAVLGSEFTFLAGRPAQQRIQASGGWPGGDAKFVGEDPKDGAVITYYQPTRAIFGKLKLEVLDAKGRVVDTLPASKRPGINRVVWSMRAAPPRVPPAAQVAFGSSQGPRFPPGTYTLRMTKAGKVYTTTLTVIKDRRATFSLADRAANFAAAQRVSAVFGRMTDLVERIASLRDGASAKAAGLKADDPQKVRLTDVAAKAELLRKEIVATKEGGAVTGEERLRERTDDLYGAIESWEGAPSAYQLKRIDVLSAQLDGIARHFDALAKGAMVVIPALPATATIPGGGTGESSTRSLDGWTLTTYPR